MLLVVMGVRLLAAKEEIPPCEVYRPSDPEKQGRTGASPSRRILTSRRFLLHTYILEHVSIEELYQQGDVVIDLAPVQLFRQRMKLIGSGLRNSDTTLHKIFMICNDWNSYHTNINTTIMEHFPEQETAYGCTRC